MVDNRIRSVRREKYLSGTKISELLGISAQYYYDIEKGKRNLSADMAAQLADIFGVSVDYLLGRSDQVNEEQTIYSTSTSPINIDKLDFKELLDEDLEITFDGVPLDDNDKEKIKKVMEALFWDKDKKQK